MSDPQVIADRVEIGTLCAEYSDAIMMHDFDRLAALFTGQGALRMPHISEIATGPADVRAMIERLQGMWEYFIQTTHPGVIHLAGDTAAGRVYLHELMHGSDGTSHQNFGMYHDRYERTHAGWKFAERIYEVRFEDARQLPAMGSAPTPM